MVEDASSPNPTLDTVIAVARALNLRVRIEPAATRAGPAGEPTLPEGAAAAMFATVKAVAQAPPRHFAGDGQWQAMRGSMKRFKS